jgi:hypothetical protein
LNLKSRQIKIEKEEREKEEMITLSSSLASIFSHAIEQTDRVKRKRKVLRRMVSLDVRCVS